MTVRLHSLTAQIAYQLLVSLLLNDAAADVRGAPTLRTIRGNKSWNDRCCVGVKLHEHYAGDATGSLIAAQTRSS